MELVYNTAKEGITLSEYGRGVQEMVQNLKSIEDLEVRTRMAHTIFKVMVNLDPSLKELENYEQKVWDHIHIMGDYELNIVNQYEKPSPEALGSKPEPLGYKGALTRYRFYGRNLLEMIDGAKDLPDGEIKTLYINYIASFMVNSSNNWNDETLTPEQVVVHLADLSQGKLQVDPSSLDIHIEAKTTRPKHRNNSNNRNKKKKYKRR